MFLTIFQTLVFCFLFCPEFELVCNFVSYKLFLIKHTACMLRFWCMYVMPLKSFSGSLCKDYFPHEFQVNMSNLFEILAMLTQHGHIYLA